MPDAIVEELERQKMFATQDMLSLVEHAKVLAKNEYWYTNSPPTTTDLIRAIGQRILDQEGPVDRYEKRPFELSCCVDHVFGPNDAHLARVEVARFYGHEADHEAEIHARYLTNKLPKS
jgi:hypothetical protein